MELDLGGNGFGSCRPPTDFHRSDPIPPLAIAPFPAICFILLLQHLRNSRNKAIWDLIGHFLPYLKQTSLILAYNERKFSDSGRFSVNFCMKIHQFCEPVPAPPGFSCRHPGTSAGNHFHYPPLPPIENVCIRCLPPVEGATGLVRPRVNNKC